MQILSSKARFLSISFFSLLTFFFSVPSSTCNSAWHFASIQWIFVKWTSECVLFSLMYNTEFHPSQITFISLSSLVKLLLSYLHSAFTSSENKRTYSTSYSCCCCPSPTSAPFSISQPVSKVWLFEAHTDLIISSPKLILSLLPLPSFLPSRKYLRFLKY